MTEQRADAVGLRTHDVSDPEFGKALRSAAQQGVEVYAYGCQVEPAFVQIAHALPVHLNATL